MEIYKFGGASVKDANGVRNIHNIVKQQNEPLIVVISAMGKTTNLLEEIYTGYIKNEDVTIERNKLIETHEHIIHDLFGDSNNSYLKLYKWFVQLLGLELQKEPSLNPDFDYDRIVSFGELFSTAIISAWFHSQNSYHQWIDARKVIRTNSDYKEGKINWDLTTQLIQYNVQEQKCPLYITQGFLGSTETDQTVTLGREGSDFSAAIFANAINATKMTIWKDVPGVMNADPRWYAGAKLIEEMSYKEAVEMSYFGASVLHPKTLKPLQNKQIPLWVRSFIQPEKEGTLIHRLQRRTVPLPVLIKKQQQALITVMPKDFSFMLEENLIHIFTVLEKFRINVNIMEKAALSFTACVNFQEQYFLSMIDELKTSFTVKFNTNLELLTIRHYTQELIAEFTSSKKCYMEQRNRDTAWFVTESITKERT